MMRTSVPTTHPPRCGEWRGLDEPMADPPWTWERVEIWRPGCFEVREVEPALRIRWAPAGSMWRPRGRRLTTSEVMCRLIRQQSTD